MTRVAAACVLSLAWGRGVAAGQLSPEPRSAQAVSPVDLQSAIDNLGKLDYDIRTSASRVVRRSLTSLAVAALVDAAVKHADGYVQYRALVLLTGFNDSRTTASMQLAMASPNDRLCAFAYGFCEHNPDRRLGTRLLAAQDKETGEFVRPSLVRALAALSSVTDDDRIHETLIREAGRGQDFFRNPGYQDSLRATAAALAQLAAAAPSFERGTVDALIDVGPSSGESTPRAPVSLAVATIALRRTPAMLSALEARPDPNAAIALLGEGFDGLAEDYEKERFFAFVRRSYWEAPKALPPCVDADVDREA